jgi:hypothetical protein
MKNETLINIKRFNNVKVKKSIHGFLQLIFFFVRIEQFKSCELSQ